MDTNLPGTFLLNGPSLGAFPEAKAPVCQYSVQSSFYKLGPPGLGAQLAAGTPHGISDILGRPAATPNSSLLPSYPHAGGFNGLSSPGVYYGPQVGALPKAASDYLPRGQSCWAEAAPEWRGGRQCGARKYGGAGGGGGQAEAAGGGAAPWGSAESRPDGTGAGAWGSHPSHIISMAQHEARVAALQAAPGRRGFGSRAGAGTMVGIGSLLSPTAKHG